MNKSYLFSTALFTAIFLFYGCSDKNENNSNEIANQINITVGIPTTRTSMGDKIDGEYPIYWSEDDKLVANGVVSSAATIGSDKTSATFTFIGETLSAPYNITYPYTEESLCTDNRPTVVFPREQQYTEGSFGTGYAPMCGYFEGNGELVTLKHLAGVLLFPIKGSTTLTKIEIIADEGMALAGEFDVDCQAASISVIEGKTTNTITYIANQSLSIETNSLFYITIPTGNYGMCKVIITDNNGLQMSLKWDATNVKPGVVREFSEIEFKPGVSFTLEGMSSESDELLPEDSSITYDWYINATDNVYEIDSAEDLVALSKLTNGDIDALTLVGAESAINFKDATINLMTDISLKYYCSELVGSWIPIGNFWGIFNGNNHTISNLYCNTTKNAGLFSYLAGAIIRDLIVQGEITCSEHNYVGGVAANASNSLFENCISEVNISTSTTGMHGCVGGVCGRTDSSTFIACQSTGKIYDRIEEWEWHNYIGGIAGYSVGSNKFIACCKLTGAVIESNSQSYTHVGGILGTLMNSEKIQSCYTGNISIGGREPGYITNTGRTNNIGNAKIADCFYSGSSCKGIGTDNYSGSSYSYDSGTARSTNIVADIVIMNNGIDEWNAANPDYICNYKYELGENGILKLVKQVTI